MAEKYARRDMPRHGGQAEGEQAVRSRRKLARQNVAERVCA